MAIPFMATGLPARARPRTFIDLDEKFPSPRRQFDPATSARHRDVPKCELVIFNVSKQVSHLQYLQPGSRQPAIDTCTLVVSLAGASTRTSSSTPSSTCSAGVGAGAAAWGLYFGPGSPYNACGRLPAHVGPATRANAEVEALVQALAVVADMTAADLSLRRVCIASDSGDQVEAMAIWVEDWIVNGGVAPLPQSAAEAGDRNDALAGASPGAHRRRQLARLRQRLEQVEYGDDGGVEVNLWHVPKERNLKARALAMEALEGASGNRRRQVV